MEVTALKETSFYGPNVRNHTYVVKGTTLVAYQPFSEGEFVLLRTPIKQFSKTKRTFEEKKVWLTLS